MYTMNSFGLFLFYGVIFVFWIFNSTLLHNINWILFSPTLIVVVELFNLFSINAIDNPTNY